MLPPLQTEKVCKVCGVNKPANEFSTYNSRSGRRTLRHHCKRCAAAAAKAKYLSDPDKVKAQRRRSAHRSWIKAPRIQSKIISRDNYMRLFRQQGGLCAICRKPEQRKVRKWTEVTPWLAVDHDHHTGAIRGLLCGTCNRGLGMFDDDPQLLMEALVYLQEGTDAVRKTA